MNSRDKFWISASYWSQSETSSQAEPSHLSGSWRKIDLLGEANDYLARSASSAPAIDLKAADIVERSGKFADISDALYYRVNSKMMPLPHDILDRTKLVALWRRRLPRLRDLGMSELVDDFSTSDEEIAATAAAEYLLHEVGHRLGFSLFDKRKIDFFRISGKLRWPLVFYEEFRADINALAASADFVPEVQYRRIIAFQLGHRLGLALDSQHTSGEPAGLVPFLMLHFLLEHGHISVRHSSDKHFLDIERDPKVISNSLKRHAAMLAESDAHWQKKPLSTALRHANYVRKCLANDHAVSVYNEIVDRSGSNASL